MLEPEAITAAAPDAASLELLARYPEHAVLVKRVFEEYRQNALAIERTDGLRGLTLLDKLGVEAIFLYERHPNDFRRLRDSLSDAAAADVLLHWREYFSLKHADDSDRRVLISEITRLNAGQRRVAAKYPNILPLLCTDGTRRGYVARHPLDRRTSMRLTDALALLGFISLEPGAADLRSAVRTLDTEDALLAALAPRSAFKGSTGFALVSLYGSVLHELGTSVPLDKPLILLRVSQTPTTSETSCFAPIVPATVAAHLRHVAAVRLTEAVGGSPNAASARRRGR